MNQKERFEILSNEEIDKEVYLYLKSLLEKLDIEILGKHKGNIIDLMKKGLLEGWCWQTTESAALFMPDNTVVFRANLYFDLNKTYYHSFIKFNYEDNYYIFDPCLCLINTAELYLETFNADIKGYTTSKQIKEYFINYINNPPKKRDYFRGTDNINKLMKELFGEETLEESRKEVVIYDKEDPSAPMYRNGSGYKNIELDNNKINSLTVHYYMSA